MKLIVTLSAKVNDEDHALQYLAALRQWLSDKPGVKGTAEIMDNKTQELTNP